MNLAVLSASLLAVRLFGPLDHLLYSEDRLNQLTLAIGTITMTNFMINSSIAAIAMTLASHGYVVAAPTHPRGKGNDVSGVGV